MLTDEQKYNNKIRYLELLGKLNIDLTNLLEYLEGRNYFDQPVTPQSHRAYPGGLVEYQLKLADRLGSFCEFFYPGKYSKEDIIKVALFKDFYRGFMYFDTGKVTDQNEIIYKTLDTELRPTFGDLGLSSYMLAKHFIDFTDEQALAIIHAKSDSYTPDYADLLKSYPLITLLKMADLAVQNIEV